MRKFRPAQVLSLGYLAIILLGTLLLSLPAASTARQSAGVFDAAFTAVSATCVTGLSVLDVGRDFTLFGQLVILLLIEAGGLGFMLLATVTMVALRRRISLQSRMILRESMSLPGLSGGVRTTLRFFTIVVAVQLIGAVLLAVAFLQTMPPARAIYFGLFHSVSAFCNAGFDLFGGGRSLLDYSGSGYVLAVISSLIVLGGLGFTVLSECLEKRGRVKALSLHSKIVLTVTAGLLLFGALFFLFSEWDGALPFGRQLLNAAFQSVTVRTAGFASVDQANLSDAGKAMSTLLMFIGASPASTGGGVKTTTVSVLFLIVLSVARGREDITAFKRRLPVSLVRTALSILIVFLALVFAGVIALSLTERAAGIPFIDLMYETVSALATVGLSSAGTARFSPAGRCILMLYMYLGRVGPMTMMLTFTGRFGNRACARYPEEQMIIG